MSLLYIIVSVLYNCYGNCIINVIFPEFKVVWLVFEDYRGLVGKPEGKITHGRPKRRWEDNIKMDLQEVESGGVDWIELAQDRDRQGGTCECGNEPSGSIKCGEFLD